MTTKAPSTIPGHEQSIAHHKEVLSRMAALLKPLGFRRKGVSFWKVVEGGSRFAGFVASITPRRGTKKVEFQVVTMGGWEELHTLLWPSWESPKPFQIGWEFAQFEHHLAEPRGEGFVAKVWTLWPSTRMSDFWPPLRDRIEKEGLVAVDDMLDRRSLLDSIENEVRRGRIYIRAKDFERTPEIIARLRSAC